MEPNLLHTEIERAPWYWQVLACIGEQFTEGEEISGVAVNVRGKGDRIELWTRSAANEAKQVLQGTVCFLAVRAFSMETSSPFHGGTSGHKHQEAFFPCNATTPVWGPNNQVGHYF
jgi:hypothetical protein